MRCLSIALALLMVANPLLAGDEPAPSAAAKLLAEADALFHARTYAEATEVYGRAAAAADEAKETEVLVEALAMAARGHLIRDDAKAGRPLLARAAARATEKAPRGWSRYLGVRGRFEWKAGDKATATKTFETMYAYCLEHDLYERAVDAAHMVAITGTKEQQVAWAHRGIQAAEKGGMDGWLGPLWNNLGVTHQEAGREAEALVAYKRARHYHWKTGGEVNKLAADWAVGMTLRRLGRHDEARTWMRPVLAWAQRRHAQRPEPERGEWVGLALLELGLIAKAEGERDTARADLERARVLLEAVNLAEWHPVLWRELTEALAAIPPANGR